MSQTNMNILRKKEINPVLINLFEREIASIKKMESLVQVLVNWLLLIVLWALISSNDTNFHWYYMQVTLLAISIKTYQCHWETLIIVIATIVDRWSLNFHYINIEVSKDYQAKVSVSLIKCSLKSVQKRKDSSKESTGSLKSLNRRRIIWGK